MKKSARPATKKKVESSKSAQATTKTVRARVDKSMLKLIGEPVAQKAQTHRPTKIAKESAEEREKRLASRKARTLKAFQVTYENRRHKDS